MGNTRQPVRVRVAPSPTGPLHVGTARTALFNELFARQHGGQLIVRIEDTDRERSEKKYEDEILHGLTWLGLTWDEGPDIASGPDSYRQSERVALYAQEIQRLLDAGHAYQEKGNEAVKLKVAPQEVSFEDLVRGNVATHSDSWGGDFVIARTLRDPVYHLAVVVDDAAMHISHVIRGEDHVSNTPRHIVLQRALGYRSPHYAHLPLLLDEKRKKLSKRGGETSLLAYRDEGFLPEAMMNYLALLGWNPGDNRELFSHQELIKEFSLERIQKGGAIFSPVKLTSINKHYIKIMDTAELWQRTKAYHTPTTEGLDDTYMTRAVGTEQERAETLKDLSALVRFYVPGWEADYAVDILRWRKMPLEETWRKDTVRNLKTLAAVLQDFDVTGQDTLTRNRVYTYLMGWIDENQHDRGAMLWPLRVALSGREHSPGPFDIIAVLGIEETVRRIGLAVAKLTHS